MISHLGMSDSVTLWTVAHQSPLSMGFFSGEDTGWVAISSSRGSSRPKDRTHVSCVSCLVGGFFTCRVTGEAQVSKSSPPYDFFEEFYGIIVFKLLIHSELIFVWDVR